MKQISVLILLLTLVGTSSKAQFNGHGNNRFSMGSNQYNPNFRLTVDGTMGGIGGARLITSFQSDFKQNIVSDVRRGLTVSNVIHLRTMVNPVNGIMGTDTYYVRGDGLVSTIFGFYIYSDMRLKENIKTIDSPLDKIMKLRGVYYNLKVKNNSDLGKTKIGFIAQELLEIIPEVVLKDNNGIYSVNYSAVIPLLLEGMKEQQTLIEGIKDELSELKRMISNNNSNSNSENNDLQDNADSNLTPYLGQNVPNPFSQEATIKYELFQDYSKVVLRIYDLNGKQLGVKQMSNKSGRNEVIIDGNLFSPGIYIYALFIDEREVDSKKMYITE